MESCVVPAYPVLTQLVKEHAISDYQKLWVMEYLRQIEPCEQVFRVITDPVPQYLTAPLEKDLCLIVQHYV